MARIFISYARKDFFFVDRLREDLTRAGLDYWIDREGLSPGTTSWERAIREAIKACESVLWIVSPSAFDSPYVRDEVSIARLYKRRIYPIFAAGEQWLECVPLGTGEIQYIDARADYHAAFEEIRKALGSSASAYVVPEERTPTLPAGKSPRNPYKGLLPFSEKDAGDFFGREALVASLHSRVLHQIAAKRDRFLAVLGPSGAGKSSVVMAGLIPALKRSQPNWDFLPVMVPGKHPVEAAADALSHGLPEKSLTAIEADLRSPGGRMLHRLARQIEAEQVVLVIDQFEELFTLTEDEDERQQFISLIAQAAAEPDGKLIVLLTMRADFFGHPLNYPQLGTLVNQNNTAVLPLSITELRDAIEKPARLPDVGLTFEDGLAAEIIFALRDRDRARAGALPLLQFTLERLFAAREGTRLTAAAYQRMGGVQGAIGEYCEAVFGDLPEPVQSRLGQVFLPLVTVDADSGEPTRRRAPLESLTADPDARALIDALVENRLLQTGRDGDSRYLEITHEALFRTWGRLKDWIAVAQEDLILLRQVRAAAHDWQTKREREPGKDFDYLRWPAERLKLVNAMLERLKPELGEVERDFIEPEQHRLYRELGFDVRPLEDGLVDVTPAAQISETTHPRRYTIGARLNDIGDIRGGIGVSKGLPDVIWLPVDDSNGVYKFEFGEFEVKPFFIAKYLTTFAQFQAFIDSGEYGDPRWWEGFPEEYRPQEPRNPTNGSANAPRDTISWYQSVAFGRWMTEQFQGLELAHPSGQVLRVGTNAQIRLPTEWEWQWAAMAGTAGQAYPWGKWDEHPRANTTEASIQNRSTAVGMYPHGAAACGALDMAGNLWEWCANNLDKPEIIDGSNTGSKVLRGGSFFSPQLSAAASYRSSYDPYLRFNLYGLRLVLASPIASLNSESLDSESLKLPAAKPPSKGGVGGIPPQESPRERSQLLDIFRRRK